jgi:hypothetical protein
MQLRSIVGSFKSAHTTTQLRVGQVVVEAYTGEVLVAQTTSNSVIKSQLEFHLDEDNFKGRYLPVKKIKETQGNHASFTRTGT